MFEDFRILALGAAAVVDTVLLLAVLRRPNWRFVTIWIVLLTAGAWLWHFATFVHTLLDSTTGPWAPALHWSCMVLMTAGLLLMPCAMLHGVLRLWKSGIQPFPTPNYLYAGLYLPLAIIVPAAARLKIDPGAAFLDLLAPLVRPYVLWVTAVNVLSALVIWRVRNRLELPRAAQFGAWMTAILLALSASLAFVVLASPGLSPRSVEVLHLAVSLTPVAPVLLFAYFVIRFQFLPLVLERTLAYGAVVTGVLFFHRIVTRHLTAAVEDRYHFDLAIVEGVAAIALILAYPPLRERTAEALRYLLGGRVDRLRDQTRQLAVQMSALAGQPPEDLLAWFVDAATRALHVDYASGWLFAPSGQVAARRGESARLSDDDARRLRSVMLAADIRFCRWSAAPDAESLAIMQRGEASIAVVVAQQNVAGLLVLGRQRLQQQPGNEEINALLLLVEQLASTMNNSVLQAERMLAERRALQNEKLSTLGLLAGSIAHEVKNPLSSIKTIVSVLAEQLDPASEHQEDLRLVLSEVDRLSTTTSQLLDFARPAANGAQGRLVPVLGRTLQIMRHVARQCDVAIDARLSQDLPAVRADDASLREIFFNLLSNSIDAAGRGGQVEIICRQEDGYLVTEFHDGGPGIAADVQDRLFEPFFSTKSGGTGLGLYVVARRVRELGGEVSCRSAQGLGTSFIVKLPPVGDPL